MSLENVVKRGALAIGLALSSCVYPLKEGELRVYSYLKFPRRASLTYCLEDNVLEHIECFHQSIFWDKKEHRYKLLIYDNQYFIRDRMPMGY